MKISLAMTTAVIVVCGSVSQAQTDTFVTPATGSTPPAAVVSPQPVDIVPANYLVAPDDVLAISVVGEPGIQNVFMSVTPEGIIAAPVVGEVQASGRTVSEIKKDIANKFVEMRYLKNPVIQLTIYQVHKMRVRVLGQVTRPGMQQMRDGDTLSQAVSDAGSFMVDSADLANATLTRQGESKPMPINLEALFDQGDLSQDIKLKDGDTLYIPEATNNKYYVSGYVNQPRQFVYKKGMTVSEAIGMAGGAANRGSLKKTVVIRRSADGLSSEKIPVDVSKIMSKGDVSGDIELKPGDVVYVPETAAPNYSIIGQVLGALSNATYLFRYGFE